VKPLPVVPAAASSADADDEMLLLDSLLRETSDVCAFDTCKRSTATLGSTCPFCHMRFCYQHSQAEVHGCGDDARAAARTSWRAAHSSSGGAGAKPLSAATRQLVAAKLHSKLEESAASRQVKTKKADGSGKKK
jgi:hypothetical protein